MGFNKKFFTTAGIVASTPSDSFVNTDNFAPILYSGNNANTYGGKVVTGLDFQPELMIVKNRTISGENWAATDVVSGFGKIVYPNLALQQGGSNDTFFTAISNGFYVNTNNLNLSSSDYVAWCWKAGGYANTFNVLENGSTTSSATAAGAGIIAGSITSGWSVSANRDAGFSIVKFTAPSGSNVNFTAGHGLSQIPEIVISKVTSRSGTWHVWNKDLPNTLTDYLKLNDTNATISFANMWGTGQTSSVISHRTDASAYPGEDHIAYCFHSVDGYQKIGSYNGNSSTQSINVGFAPRFVLVKSTSAGNWHIFDSERGDYKRLFPDLSNAESISTNQIYFESNGFASGNGSTNSSGKTYIYLAIA